MVEGWPHGSVLVQAVSRILSGKAMYIGTMCVFLALRHHLSNCLKLYQQKYSFWKITKQCLIPAVLDFSHTRAVMIKFSCWGTNLGFL